jgi:hypothetical protein
MIIVKIFGGLGNQMFQYAFGKALSLKLNRKLMIDKSYFNKENYPFDLHPTYYPYLLDKYHIDEGYVSSVCSKYGKLMSKKRAYLIINPIIERLGLNTKYPMLLTKRNYAYETVMNSSFIYLNGYWQNQEKIIARYQNKIRNALTPNNISGESQKLVKKMGSENSVSIHFRKGDYLSNPKFSAVYADCSVDYYNKAMKIIEEKTSGPTYYIFSDNYGWVRENIKIRANMVLMDYDIQDHEQLYLMSQCKHNIIANSSYSWWGANLNQNVNKVVICPKEWVKTNKGAEFVDFDLKDRIPKDWVLS